eukprot:SAG11_NODE_3392_length_2477_cov_1.339781_1_plen_86_part_00
MNAQSVCAFLHALPAVQDMIGRGTPIPLGSDAGGKLGNAQWQQPRRYSWMPPACAKLGPALLYVDTVGSTRRIGWRNEGLSKERK